MPNVLKYTTGAAPTRTLKKGSFYIGCDTVDYGTSFYTGITPPSGGYTIYLNKASGGPSIYCPANDTQLIFITNQIAGTNYITANECFNYFAGQSDKMVVQRDYEGITTNGLVLNLDAGYLPSYPQNGTSWYDLGPNGNTGTLTNSPTYNSGNGGSIVFDGVDDYVNTNFTTQLNNFTICSWFKCTGVTAWARIADKSYNTGFWFGKENTNANKWGGGVKQNSNYNMITLDDTNWHYLVMVRNGTSLTVYGDGVTNNNTTTCGSGSIDSTALSIGGTINDGGGQRDWYKGNIPIVKVYDRVLTTAEILQNYNAQKARFGL